MVDERRVQAGDLPFQLKDAYDYLRRTLAEGGIDSADFEARLILEHRGGFSWSDLIARGDAILGEDIRDLILSDLARRVAGESLGRMYGEREFFGLPFFLSPETLEPRADTEVLVERALAIFSERGPAAILDMGTGSGCILISLLSRFLDSYGVGLDLSYGALLTARRNAARNGVLNRSGFICGSWGDSLGKKFDLVVSNPPYIANHVIPSLQEEVRDHDPILGLDGGADGLQAYRDIFSGLNSLLAPDGKALLEIGFDQGDSVMRLAEDSGFCVEGVWPDYAGLPRVVEISSGDK